jgi:hypothetical protein
MNIALLLLVASLIGALLIACMLFLQRRLAPKFQFSLRSFLGLLAIVGILFAWTIGYRRNTMAQLTWIPVVKEDAAKFFPAATVQKSADGRFEFVYYARNRAIQHLIAKNKLRNYSVTEEAVRVTSTDESEAEELLQLLQKTDTLSGGAFVIRGKLSDANGIPVPGATIDILGAFQFINCFRTRDDGTFTLALSDRDPSVPVGAGLYFRIRSADDTADNPVRWNSSYFSLDPNNPEMLLDIQIPK